MEKEKRKLVVVVTITNEQMSWWRRLVHSWLAVAKNMAEREEKEHQWQEKN
jgi:hypothetical protein